MVIQHNLEAMNANRQLYMAGIDMKKSSEKLSSGYRINRAADDAAGLSVSEKMRRQIRGLTQASFNAQDGVSMVQTAEGALNEVHDMLQRMNELCVKAANGTMTFEDRGYIQKEINSLSTEIDRVGASTTFNEIKLFDGLPQTKTTAVVPYGTINGTKGTITQATQEKDAIYTINKVEAGDIAAIPYDDETMYFKAATDEEIAEYKRDHPDDFAELDGLSAEKAKMVNMDEFHREIAHDLMRANTDANSDVANGASCYYVIGESPTEFRLHINGPLPVTLQVGSESDHTYRFEINSVGAMQLGVYDINVQDEDGAGALNGIDKVKKAIERNSLERSNLGAVQNRLEHMIKNLDNVVENTTAAESRIRDTDMASEIQKNSNLSIIQQAGQTILAQANQSKQGVLTLLQ